jgi:hypothetical protein
MLLGRLIKNVMRAQGTFVDGIANVDPQLVQKIDSEAALHGTDRREFVADTIGRFMAHEDGESWTTIIGNIQRSDDPGFAFISTVMRARLDHHCNQHA